MLSRFHLRWPRRIVSKLTLLPCLALGSATHAQILDQDITEEVHNLPHLMARTPHRSDVLLTSLDTVFHDHEICCVRDSALEDSAQAADPKSLKDVAGKLDGRHLLGDGRPIKVKAEFVRPDQLNSGYLVSMILSQHAPLMEWNSRVYVVHGIVYRWTATSDGEGTMSQYTVIHKFLLWDTRYSDSRREVVFDRATDDPKTVQGLLFLDWKMD
jgi:hypothetical protein